MSVAENLSLMLAKLKDVKSVGENRWYALCPAHDDEHRSLSIKVGEKTGAIVAKCHAPKGCTFKAIVESLGLRITDLFPKPTGKSTMTEFKNAYSYRDSTGKLIYEVVRTDPKGFYQRRPNAAWNPKGPKDRQSNPEFINNLEGITKIIYRLPEFLAAMKAVPNRVVFIMEGEKDCDRAWKSGIVATTNSSGALNWTADLSENFIGMNVVCIPDNDPIDIKVGYSPGKRHMEIVAASLLGKAATVKIVELPGLPDKGDFTDWWQALEDQKVAVGDRKKRLAELVLKTPLYTRPAADAPALAPQQSAAAPAAVAPVADPAPPASVTAAVSTQAVPSVPAAPKSTGDVMSSFAAYCAANPCRDMRELEWFGSFQANRLLIEAIFNRNVDSREALRDIIFLTCHQLLNGVK